MAPFHFVIRKEGKWLSAWCPVLDIATQGKDEKELGKNIRELLEIYFAGKGMCKPRRERPH